MLNILNISLVAGMVALPITTVQTVQSRVTVGRTGTIRTSGHTYRTTTRISHTIPNLSKNAHRSSQMHLATYQKSFYLLLVFFIVILAGFLLTCFVIFLNQKRLIFIYPDVNNTFVHKSLAWIWMCFEVFDTMYKCVLIIWSNIYQCRSGNWV